MSAWECITHVVWADSFGWLLGPKVTKCHKTTLLARAISETNCVLHNNVTVWFQKNLWVADMEKAWVRFTPHSNTQPRSFQLEVNSIPLQAAVRLGSAVWHCEGEVITFWSSPATQRLFRRCRQCPPLIDHSHQRNVRPWTQVDKLTKRQRTFREGSFN